jgi:hypothetical protein
MSEISPNGPQQRPRDTGVICKHNGIAGSAACGGSCDPVVNSPLSRLREALSVALEAQKDISPG